MRKFRQKIELHNSILKEGGTSTDTKIINFDIVTDTPGLSTIKKKLKFTYRCYNAGEEFTGEIFDGTKLSHMFNITDLGVTRNSSAYCVLSANQLKARIDMLYAKGIEFIESLY